MKVPIVDLLTALATAVLAAIGGAAFVVAEIDDAPGAGLLGLLLILGAAAIILRRRGN